MSSLDAFLHTVSGVAGDIKSVHQRLHVATQSNTNATNYNKLISELNHLERIGRFLDGLVSAARAAQEELPAPVLGRLTSEGHIHPAP